MRGSHLSLRMFDDFTVGTMIGGAVSATCSRIILFPLDTCKANLQVIPNEHPSFKTVIQRTYHADGLVGFYRGFGVSLIGAVPAQCFYFTTYELTRKMMTSSDTTRKSNMIADLTAGFIAEMVSCILWVPIDVTKERLQTQSTLKVTNYRGSIDALRTISKQEGIRHLYKGYGATLMSFGPSSALYFMFYEKFRERAVQWNQSDVLPGWLALACGIASGTLSAYITTPLDLVKLRLQVQRTKHMRGGIEGKETVFKYGGFWGGLKELFKNEGVRGLFAGGGARVLFSAPSMAIGVGVTEMVRQWYIGGSSR